MTGILFLDIDGTVRKGYNELGYFVNSPEDVEVYPEAINRIAEWKDRGGRIVGVSNQGGIEAGHTTYDSVRAAMRETNRQTAWLFDAIHFCPHIVAGRCFCRKPGVGLLFAAMFDLGPKHKEVYSLSQSCMVGDMWEDMACAQRMGLPFLRASDWRAGKPFPVQRILTRELYAEEGI